MSKRIIRVNELLRREISEQLHSRYRSASVAITISEVETSPDLRQARVFYSVVGGEGAVAEAGALFDRIGKELGHRVSRRVVLKYFPRLEFVHDRSLERGARIVEILEELENEEQ
ncbi:MAG: 30S ribosome-binding factor RbfA [Opitutales bacterium]